MEILKGSKLGSFLFNINIEDICTSLKYCFLHLNTDDLQIYLHFKVNEIENFIA